MKFHPYAEIFPLLGDAPFDELVADIKQHGLREKIWLYEGKILDGRNRFLACKTAKIEPEFREYKGDDALAFVVSLNVQRRHLTESQRAMAAAKIATLPKGSNQHASIEASSQGTAAKSLKVGRSSVQRAKQVIEKGSKALQKAVETGEVSVSKAAKVVDLPKPEQLKAAKAPKPEEDSDAPERPSEEEFAAIDREIQESEARVLRADDVTAGYHEEMKRQAAEIAVLKVSRDGYMRGKDEMTRLLQAEQRKVARLEKENKRLRDRLAALEGKAA